LEAISLPLAVILSAAALLAFNAETDLSASSEDFWLLAATALLSSLRLAAFAELSAALAWSLAAWVWRPATLASKSSLIQVLSTTFS